MLEQVEWEGAENVPVKQKCLKYINLAIGRDMCSNCKQLFDSNINYI